MTHKFLHLADIHFDTPFFCRSESLRAKLKKELQAAFKRAVDFAIGEKMMAVVIAGDLVDGNRLSLGTESFLLEQLYRLDAAQIPCIYVSGHSDPVEAMSRIRDISWPASFVHIRERSPKVIELQDIDGSAVVRLVGVGYEPSHHDQNPALLFPRANGDVPYVGVMHARVATGDESRQDDPEIDCEVKHLKRAGYVYWALGHGHEVQQLEGIDQAWYAGNLVGSDPTETGAKGGLVVSLSSDGKATAEFKTFSGVRWYDLRLDELENVRNDEDLIRLVELAFAVESSNNEAVTVQLVRLTLSGMCPMADDLQTEARRTTIAEKIAQRLGVDDVVFKTHRLTLPVDVDAFRDEPHLLSEVLDLIERVSEDPDLLSDLGPDSLAKQVASDEDRKTYLTNLLNALDREAIIRLTHEDGHAN